MVRYLVIDTDKVGVKVNVNVNVNVIVDCIDLESVK